MIDVDQVRAIVAVMSRAGSDMHQAVAMLRFPDDRATEEERARWTRTQLLVLAASETLHAALMQISEGAKVES